MIGLLRLPSTFLRAGMLALLLLGAIAKPMLASVCEMHALRHTLSALRQSHAGDDATMEHQIDRDHSSGRHGALHEGDSDGAYAHIVAEMVLPQVMFEATMTTLAITPSVPAKPASVLLRPPIA